MELLTTNRYSQVGSKIFTGIQVIGIPMGSDPAAFFANLFFSSPSLKSVKKANYGDARFGNFFRFIDDLIAVNDKNAFENKYNESFHLN